jgi:superfamily II DNA or RNA helicase
MNVYQNKYPSKCNECGASLPPMKGFVYGNRGGRYIGVCTSTACIEDAPAAVKDFVAKANEPAKPASINEAGEIVMPFNREALPILRGMPGARWNGQKKCWTVSTAMKDRARVVSACERLQLAMPEGFAILGMSNLTQLCVDRAAKGGAYDYQREGVKFLAEREKALLADDMGLGKTFQSIQAIEDRAIVVCPASLKLNWANEVTKWRPGLTPIVCNGRKGFVLPQEGEVVILNYDILPTELTPTDKWGNESANVPTEWIEVLAKTTLIADEAHLCKSHKAMRSKRTKVLSRLCAKSWAMTGTPLLSRGFDLYGVLETFGMAYEVFGGFKGFTRLMRAHKNRWGGWEFGTPDVSVPEKMRRVMLRRLKTEVLTDLPGKRHQTVQVPLGRSVKRMADDAWGKMQDLGMKELPGFEKFSGIRALLAEDRISALEEMVESYEEAGEAIVVFSAHRAPILAMGQREGWAVIMGDTPQAKRQQAVEDFQAGKLKGIACTIAAGGTGITLTHASTMIFCDLAWNPALNAQAEDRICRIGQKAESIQYIRLVSNHPMDLHVMALLDEKQDMINASIENECEAVELVEATPRAAIEIVDESRGQRDARLSEVRRKIAEKRVEDRRDEWTSRTDAVISRATVSPLVRESVVAALEAMQGACDGAATKDGAGFNKPDATIMNYLSAVDLREDEDLLRFAWSTLAKYRRQLGGMYPALFSE